MARFWSSAYLLEMPCGYCRSDLEMAGTVVCESFPGVIIEYVALETNCAEHEGLNLGGVA